MGKDSEGSKYTIKLIEKASEATLCATDQDGLTPLHLAVDYQRASEMQFNIVQALIAHGDAALDQYTLQSNEVSVYEYHQSTRPLSGEEPKPGGAATTTSRSLEVESAAAITGL